MLKDCSLAFLVMLPEKQGSSEMCFSAAASFGASAVIGAISTACFLKSTTRASKVWACVPLFFAVQQGIQGMLWLALTHEHQRPLLAPAMYGFLLFAQVVWPAMIPIAAFSSERDASRKKILRSFLWFGAGVAGLHLIALLVYSPHAIIGEPNMRYVMGQPKSLRNIGDILYFISAVLPLFISTIRPVKWMGAALLTSYIVSKTFYQDPVISIWCYLAALMSFVVYWIIVRLGQIDATESYRTKKV